MRPHAPTPIAPMPRLPRSMSIHRLRRLAAWVIAAAVASSPPRAQAQLFEFGPQPVEAPITRAALATSVRVLDERDKDLRQRLSEAAREDDKLAIQASLQVASLARQLLSSVDERASSSRAALAGLTLLEGADALDALFAQLPKLSRALDAKPTPTEAELRRLDRLRDALRRFAFGGPPKSVTAEAFARVGVEEYCHRHLAPLLRALEAVGTPAPTSAWIARDGKPAAQAPTDAAFDDLARRLTALQASRPGAAAALTVLQVLRTASAYPDFRPRVADQFAFLEEAAAYAQSLEGAAWMSQPVRSLLDSSFTREMEAFREPTTRPLATEALRRMFILSGLLNRLGELKLTDPELKPLRELAGIAINRIATGTDAATGQAVIDWLDLATRRLRERQGAAEETPEGGAGVVDALRKDFADAVAQVVRRAERMLLKLDAVREPESTAALDRLALASVHLDVAFAFARDIREVRSFNPLPPSAIPERLGKQLRVLGNENRRDAAAELTAFHEQLARMQRLPGLAEMTRLAQEDTGSQALGITLDQLLKAINRQRSQWAMKWAQGAPATEGEAIVAVLERLLPTALAAHQLHKLGDKAPLALNRWPGWEVSPQASGAALRALSTRVQAAAGLAVSGRSRELNAELDGLEADHPHAALAAILLVELGPHLDALPQNAAGVLAQLVYSPTPGAFLGPVAHEVAVISRCANELAESAVDGDDAKRNAVLTQARAALDRIRAHRRQLASTTP